MVLKVLIIKVQGRSPYLLDGSRKWVKGEALVGAAHARVRA